MSSNEWVTLLQNAGQIPPLSVREARLICANSAMSHVPSPDDCSEVRPSETRPVQASRRGCVVRLLLPRRKHESFGERLTQQPASRFRAQVEGMLFEDFLEALVRAAKVAGGTEGIETPKGGELGRLLESLFMALEEDLFRASQSECDGEEDAGDEEEAASFAQ